MDQQNTEISACENKAKARDSMVTAETIRRVRLDKHQGKSYRRIAKDRNLDRKTVLKVLKSGLTEFQYSERETQAYPQLGAYREKREALLLAESKLDRRHRRKWTRVYETLQHEGFTDGYDSFVAMQRDGRRPIRVNRCLQPHVPP